MKVFEKMKKKLSIMLTLAMVFGLVQGVSIDLTKVFADTVYNSEEEISGCAVVDMGEIALDESKEITIESGKMLAFTFTAPEDGTYYFFTEGQNDTYGVLADDVVTMNIVASDDDSAAGVNFMISQAMEKGQTYVVAVRAYNTSKTIDSEIQVMEEETFYDYVENCVRYEVSGIAVEVVPGEKTEIKPNVYACDFYGKAKGHYNEDDDEFVYDEVDITDFTFTWYDAEDFFKNDEEAEVVATTPSIDVTLENNSCSMYAIVMKDAEGNKSYTYMAAYTNDFKIMEVENYVDRYFIEGEKVEIEPVIYLIDFYGRYAGEVEDYSKYTFVWSHRGHIISEEQKLEIENPDKRPYFCEIYENNELVATTICFVYTNHEHEHILKDAFSATCTEGSKAIKVCWECGDEEEVVLSPALGHDYKEASKVDATATTDGYVEYKCTRCEDTYKDVIKATGETTKVDQNNETTKVDKNNETTNAAVKPATVKKATVKAAKKSIKISFTKAKNAKKYIVQVAKNKKFKKLVKTVKNLKKTKTTIKKMKKGKYFVRIAGVNGKTKGAWSKAFKVTVK